jgi:proteic killer suppression protein
VKQEVMLVEFEDDDLRRLYEDAEFRLPRFGRDIVRAYRKVVGFVVGANDERDLYAMRSLHFEKLEGSRSGQHSLRLNKQWRLIVKLQSSQEGKQVVVVEIVDYH